MGGKGSWREAVLTNLGAWWDASKLAAEISSDDNTTPEIWHSKFMNEIVPSLPWPKFVFGDIGHHIARMDVDLKHISIVGIGCHQLMEVWGIELPKTGLAAQAPGLEALREFQICVTAVMNSGLHKGLEAAKKEADLKALSTYDIQVQKYECKRGHNLAARIRNARAELKH